MLPESTLARLGSETHPKGYQQFEAIAYQRGADGKPYTADDVELGPIDVTWSVEEFYAVYGDDDKDFVGTLSPTGFFTPASDGPNPKRKFSRNNYGDVWVVATAKNEKDKDGKPLAGRSLPGGHGAAVHPLGSAGGRASDRRAERAFIAWASFIPSKARGRRFLYLVPAGAIFELDDAAAR